MVLMMIPSLSGSIIETEAEEIGGEPTLTGFVFYAKDFYILYLLFKHK